MPSEKRPLPIFTLNARDNVFLEVLRKHYHIGPGVMHGEIQALHAETIAGLATKGLDYANFKSALVPRSDKQEVGLIFDSRAIASSWYGHDIAAIILPLLDVRVTQSVLHGDLLGKDQDFIFEILEQFLVAARSFDFVHGSLLYCVYVNNVSEASLQMLHCGLRKVPAYLGYIPATFQSIGKTYLSMTLAAAFIKLGRQVVMVHEDDRSISEDVNTLGFPFAENGYRVRSIPSRLFDPFLTYKIERPVFAGFEIDTEMSLNSISREVHPLNALNVEIDEAKLGYLRAQKGRKLSQGQIAELSKEELAELIKEKIAATYMYNMTILPEHSVTKFDVMLEASRVDGGYPARLVAALEYRPEQRSLRLITIT